MKTISITACLFLLALGCLPLRAETPSDQEFPGLKKAMSPAEFDGAGLSKLDPAERQKLDAFIRGYVSTSNERVATSAVDKAVKDNQATAPQVIESRIVGPFRGYNGRTTFTLENGQRWAQSQRDIAAYPLVESPPVVIVKGGFGYRMHIAGGGAIRVSLIR